ncbi:hypothetical protein GCM10011494_16870 [Novosphingobium endophyticum]|uniref:Uncharacterized protein n=1 Tax=Novosphingobium endophyticum TaxID=1955250 RepID=A0A916TS45_9SPHN|nr:hypothetical protein [Novosphingobium endophyticum]GGB99057.1 hypothetical protein GCM10011494_16870 [Novosphingobium endophyticum]
MKKFVPLAAFATIAALPTAVFAETEQSAGESTPEAAVSAEINAGKMLYSSHGYRIASIYRVNQEGDPQIILSGRLVTVPASTLSVVDDKITTSLSKKEIAAAR